MTAHFRRLRCRVEHSVRGVWLWAQNGWCRTPKAGEKLDDGTYSYRITAVTDPAAMPEIVATARREAQARNAAEVRDRLGLPHAPPYVHGVEDAATIHRRVQEQLVRLGIAPDPDDHTDEREAA